MIGRVVLIRSIALGAIALGTVPLRAEVGAGESLPTAVRVGGNDGDGGPEPADLLTEECRVPARTEADYLEPRVASQNLHGLPANRAGGSEERHPKAWTLAIYHGTAARVSGMR